MAILQKLVRLAEPMSHRDECRIFYELESKYGRSSLRANNVLAGETGRGRRGSSRNGGHRLTYTPNNLTPTKSLLRSLGETNGRSRALPWTCGVTMSYKRWAIANTCRSSNYTWCPICRTWSKQTHRIAPANRWSRAGTISLCSLCERMIGCKAVRPPDVALS